MKKQQGRGLLALLGVGAGVFAWYKYRNMTPEKKQQLHDKVNAVGKKVVDTVNDVEKSISKQYNDLTGSTQTTANKAATKANKASTTARETVNDVTP